MKKYSYGFLIASCLFCHTPLKAQISESKEVNHRPLMWFDFFENVIIHEKWLLQAEVTERLYLDPRQLWQTGARLYAMYNVGENWRIGPGFSVWFLKSDDVTTHELRLAQQFFYSQKMEKRQRIAMNHRFKVEERFVRNIANGELADDYTFSMRFRYRFAFEYTVVKIGEHKRPLKLFANDEVFLQAGKKIIYNVFDQNRFNIGVSVTVAKGTVVNAGYANLFRQLSSGYEYDDLNIFRLSFIHEFAVNKRKNEQ